MKHALTLGIVCTGNTCRSPVSQAWLLNQLEQTGLATSVSTWTAGVSIRADNLSVTPAALEAAHQTALPAAILEKLDAHQATPISDVSCETDIIFWLSKAPQLAEPLGEQGLTRGEFMEQQADRLGAKLFILSVGDDAWDVMDKYRDNPDKHGVVVEAYKKQSYELREWASLIFGMVSSRSLVN